MKPVTIESIQNMRKDYLADEKASVVRNALTKNDISTISRSFEAEAANPDVFSIDLKTMPVTNQMRSGRCWIFSAMNVLREIIGKKYQITNFELSQNYVAFYDKLEKINWFMECVISCIDEPIDSETNRFLLQNAVSDGGQWNMLVSLVKKYGICPKSAMPETFQSSHTGNMNGLLNRRLRKFAADIRKENADLEALKEECLKDTYGLLASCFGLPPESFTFEYYDKDGNAHAEYNVTPLQFYENYLAVDTEDFISVINGPTSDKPYYRTYTVKHLGNVVDGSPVLLLNLPLDEFKKAALDMLKDGSPVWFGCDCSKDGDRKTGLWDDGQYDYAHTFDMDISMSKAEMLDTRHSAMNHAMVFSGVNLVDDKPTRWKIQNSWGEEPAIKGYYICTDTWFDQYVYVLAVPKKYLSEKALAALGEEPAVLAPWDPFGTLAD